MLTSELSQQVSNHQDMRMICPTSHQLVSVIQLSRNPTRKIQMVSIPTQKKRQSSTKVLIHPTTTVQVVSETFGVLENDFQNHCKFYGLPYETLKEDPSSLTPETQRSTICFFNSNTSASTSQELALNTKRKSFSQFSSSTSPDNSVFEAAPRKRLCPSSKGFGETRQTQCLMNEISFAQPFLQNGSPSDLGDFPETCLKNCLEITEQTKIHSVFTKIVEGTSSNSNKQPAMTPIEKTCKSMFKLNQLDSQKQLQFRFSLYRKKGISPFNLSNNCSTSEPAASSGVSRFGKYHNFNKLFMYNILSMFTQANLSDLGVPEDISRELQTIVARIKSSAKNNYRVAGKYAFDYFSHAHYNILFYKVSQKSLLNFADLQEYIDLYKQCFHVDLQQPVSSITISYLNIIKLYAYNVFMTCIAPNDLEIDPTSTTIENLKNQYTMKVVKGVKKLAEGSLIKRF